MTYQEELNMARESGFLKRMLLHGHISYKPIYYLDIYNDKITKNLSTKEQAERLGVSGQTVRNAIRSIKST